MASRSLLLPMNTCQVMLRLRSTLACTRRVSVAGGQAPVIQQGVLHIRHQPAGACPVPN